MDTTLNRTLNLYPNTVACWRRIASPLHISICLLALCLAPGLLNAQEEDLTCPEDFAGYLTPRVVVEQAARTTPGTPLNLRPEPGTDLARVAALPGGVTMQVVDGPLCNEGFVWWQVDYDEQTGWVAEGRLPDDYYLEPRGALVALEGEDGITRYYVADEDGEPEPEGCMRPPDDYERVALGYVVLNERTWFMVDNAERIYMSLTGVQINFRQRITQGSYNAGGVAASFGTHDGGGAVDISVRSFVDWSVMDDEIPLMIEALRTAGFAAWLRRTDDYIYQWPIHIHAIAIGDAELSAGASAQIDGEFGYLHGFDGLPRDDGPVEDRHGGPIVCHWMEIEPSADSD